MRALTLRNLFVTAIASTTLGGSTACQDCNEHSDDYDFGVSPAAFRPGTREAFGATTYEEWLDVLAEKPCDDVCQEFIWESPVTVDKCSPFERVDGGGTIHCEWTYHYCESALTSGCGSGRRPPGFAPTPRGPSGDVRGAFFASLAELESASVSAFEILARDLASLGAPTGLVREAQRAARDEVRHARAMAVLARRFDTTPVEPRVMPTGPRSLEALAVDNAIEGCARETYGAAIATWMAEAARDETVRAVMRRIAHDETRHAALSWRLARWLWRRLDGPAQRRVAAARASAVKQLARELRKPTPPELLEEKLAPPPALALALLASVENGLRKLSGDGSATRSNA